MLACVQTSPIAFVARPFPRATKEIGDVCTQARGKLPQKFFNLGSQKGDFQHFKGLL